MSEDFLIKRPAWEQEPRLIELQGTFNTRDMGGYPTQGGRQVSWGKVYRSDDLHKVTEHDIRELGRRGIISLIDFRADSEVKAAPNQVIPTIINAVHLEIRPANVIEFHDLIPHLKEGKGEGFMKEINQSLVRDFQPIYARFFEILMNRQALPVLFHCSAGKDRTGFAAALFLASLGVDREIIMADYMMSRDRALAKYAKDLETHPELFSLITVEPSYLETAFETIDREFGGMDAYLVNQLHVDRELMKSLYTE